MKTTIITDFTLTKPSSQNYNWNSEFEQSFGKNDNLRLLVFKLPDDCWDVSYRLWTTKSISFRSFNEFNRMIKGLNQFETLIILNDVNVIGIELTYMSKDDRIRELLDDIDNLNLKIKDIQHQIFELT